MPETLSDLPGAPLTPVLAGIIAAWGLNEITGRRMRAPGRLRALRHWLLW